VTQENEPSIRVGIIGAGNCARALVEGIACYRAQHRDSPFPAGLAVPSGGPNGLMHTQIGPYLPGHIEPVAAWDVSAHKVGKDLWTAISAPPNLPVGILSGDAQAWDGSYADIVGSGVTVLRGPTLDGAGDRMRARVELAADWPSYDGAEIIDTIHQAGVDVLINYLPVGSEAATEWWAHTALEAGVSFVNCIPVFLASRDYWADAFRNAGLVLLGDDIKSQLGATYLHRALVQAFSDRGIRLDRTYQLNVGGNMDFANLMDASRTGSKIESKTGAVLDAYQGVLTPADVHIGPSDFVPWLGDTKVAMIRCEGRGFAGAPLVIDVRMEVPDSPNSAGVVVDAVRIAKLAADRHDLTVAASCSAFLFKRPPRDVAMLTDEAALCDLNAWLATS